MYRYVLKRLLLMIPVLLGVTLIVFSLMYIAPGDPVQMLLGDNATQEDIDALNAKLGRDDPFVVQYVRYAGGILTRFDFGESYFTGRPVMTEILERFPNTALLAVLGCALSIVIGVTCGVIAATRQYSIFDNLATATSLIGVSMPSFWFGLLLIIFFSIQLGWLPASGSYGPLYFVMPAITLGSTARPTSCAPPARACSRRSARTTSAPRAARGRSSGRSSSTTRSKTPSSRSSPSSVSSSATCSVSPPSCAKPFLPSPASANT